MLVEVRFLLWSDLHMWWIFAWILHQVQVRMIYRTPDSCGAWGISCICIRQSMVKCNYPLPSSEGTADRVPQPRILIPFWFCYPCGQQNATDAPCGQRGAHLRQHKGRLPWGGVRVADQESGTVGTLAMGHYLHQTRRDGTQLPSPFEWRRCGSCSSTPWPHPTLILLPSSSCVGPHRS